MTKREQLMCMECGEVGVPEFICSCYEKNIKKFIKNERADERDKLYKQMKPLNKCLDCDTYMYVDSCGDPSHVTRHMLVLETFSKEMVQTLIERATK